LTQHFWAAIRRLTHHGFFAAPPCGISRLSPGKTYPLVNGKRTGGVLDESETIIGFHCCFGSDAVLVVGSGCSQQYRGKPDLPRQHRELQPDPTAIDCSSLRVHGLSIRFGPELSDRKSRSLVTRRTFKYSFWNPGTDWEGADATSRMTPLLAVLSARPTLSHPTSWSSIETGN